MTRRQVSTIIGLLFVVLVIVSVASLRQSTQAQTDVHLPIVQSDGVDASAMWSDGVIAGKHPELGVFAVRAASGVTITGDYTGSEATITPDPILADAIRKQAALTDEELQKLVETVAGPETVGAVINIVGKEIQLPPNVYVEAYVVDHFCPIDAKCLEAPSFALANKDTGARIAVSAASGEIGDPALSQQTLTQARASFQWLVDAVEGK